MSGSHRSDAMDIVPTAPSPPSASPPAFLSQDMFEEDEYEDHNPREWMREDNPTPEPEFEEDYEPGYRELIDQLNAACEAGDSDMPDVEMDQGAEMWHPRAANMHVLHSSQKTTQRKKKRVVHAVEVLDSIPERQGIGPGNVVRGDVDEKVKGKSGLKVSDYLRAFDEAMDEALADCRELEGDTIQEQPQRKHVRDESCPLCQGGVCTLRHELDAFRGIPGFDIARDESDPQCKGKGKARLVEDHETDSHSSGKGKGKARLVEEPETGLRSSGKGKGRRIEEDDLEEEDDELGFLLAQAQQLYNTEQTDKSTSKSPKRVKPSEKQKPAQSAAKKTSRSKRSGKK